MDRFRVLSVSSFDPSSPGFRRRAVRHKSQYGCRMCKAKKVKCDETKPRCLRCCRNGRTCDYLTPQVQIRPMPSPHADGSTIELISHCHAEWSAIFPGFDKNTGFMAAYKSDRLVRSVCCAIAASHLRHLRPGHKPYIVAEYSSRATAMLDYKARLQIPARKLGQAGVNTLLLSAVLFNLLAFPLPPSADAPDSCDLAGEGPWITDEHDSEMGWLTFQAGLGPLMRSMASYLPDASSFLAAIFAPGPNRTMWPNVGLSPPLVPEPWLRFFELDEGVQGQATSASLSRSYSSGLDGAPSLATSARLLVRITAYLRSVPPTVSNSVVYLAFASKAQVDFRHLLLLQDPRAWWLYGYWAGLLCRYQGTLWWCRDRAARQYAAVTRWLGDFTRNGEESGLWKEMLTELETVIVFPPRVVDLVVPIETPPTSRVVVA
ncbi:hypothetical protein CC79DRAFT_1338694 [Sarocladium strictum]